jgi:DNA-binding transcriptional MerR regulator
LQQQGLFTIGEFSRLAQVTARTLRYYQEQGLLEPMRVGENTGIRYYSANQIREVNLILGLKGTGMSLEEIRSILPQIRGGSDEMLLRLKAQAQSLETEIQAKKGNLGALQAMISALESGDARRAAYLQSARLVRRPPRSIYSVKKNCPMKKPSWIFSTASAGAWRNWISREDLPRMIPMAWSNSASLEEAQDMELAVFCPELGPHLHTKPAPEIPTAEGRLKAKEGYLKAESFALLPVQHSSDFRGAYNALGEWVASQGLETGSPLAEEYEDLEWVQGGEAKMMLWLPAKSTIMS